MIKRILSMTLAGCFMVALCYITYQRNFSQEAHDKFIYDMYQQIVTQTGQMQDVLPFNIVESQEINAYNDGKRIVMFRGLINSAKSWDEIALVLGHEVAHGMLGHLGKLSSQDPHEITVLEANADKMGAVYMMKAGFNVCVGREIYKRWKTELGNHQNTDHPDYSYRYDELNIRCE